MLKNIVERLLETALQERKDLFLINFTFTPDHQIKVVIDGDHGVKVEDCIYISRAIEHNIDRDEHDFSLEVLSSGATEPLTLPRQYTKHVGRHLEVTTKSGEHYEGKLEHVKQQYITLTWKAREPKPVGKGKVTVAKSENLAFEDIEKANVKIKF